MGKTLILTVAVGYTKAQKNAFEENLRSHGFSGKLVIIDRELPRKELLVIERIRAYRRYLMALKPGEYDTVITTDFRDVIFQGNPEDIKHSGLDFFLEDESVKIKDCPYCTQWVGGSFGAGYLAKVGNKPISCSGVVIGTPEKMLNYYTEMMRMIVLLQIPGGDQGLHIYLLYEGLVGARAVANDDGDVYTVGYVDSIIVKKHVIYNKRGKVPIIVHQYDRHLEKL